MQLEIKNLTTKRVCGTERIGSIYISGCDEFNHKFKKGICFLAGEIYEGGWSVADYLAKEAEGDSGKTEIFWNGELSSPHSVRERTYYVTDNYKNYERNKVSVEKNLKEIFKRKHLSIDYEMFVSMCELEKTGTFNRNINRTGHAFWFYSSILGLALGKKIITFPWISGQEMEIQSYRFNLLAKVSSELDCVIVVPVETAGIMNKNNLPENSYWFEVINMRG